MKARAVWSRVVASAGAVILALAIAACVLFEKETEIGLKNDYPFSVELVLLYDSGRQVRFSLASNGTILTPRYDHETLKAIAIMANGGKIRECNVPFRRSRDTWFHLSESGCFFSGSH